MNLCFLTRNTQITTIRMNKLMKVFIPFVHKNVHEKFIEKIFLQENIGQVMDIQLHAKKIRVKNELRSSNHSYAFISLYIFNNTQGNNMLRNLESDYATHVLFHYSNGTPGKLEVKPYLTVSDRLERGYHLHIKDDTFDQDSYWSQWLQITSNKIEQDKPVSISFYNNVQEKLECEKDYLDIELGLQPYYVISSFI